MKNQKMLIIFPILFLVCALGITFISESYSAADTLVETSATKYYYIRRNMLSHYYVSHNSTESDETRTASGTILIKSGNRYSSSEGSAILVYCAEQGYANSASVHTRKTLSKALKDGNLKTETAKNILNTMMQYSYPFITLSNLKVALKNPTYGLSNNDYSNYNFDNLTAQEAMTATQAAIWNATKSKDLYYKFGGTLKKISSSQSSFGAPGMTINWNKCNGYNKGTGKYKTILTTEEEKWYSDDGCTEGGQFYDNVFALRNDGHVKDRVNALVAWYANLYTKVKVDEPPEITVKSSTFEKSGDNLKATITIDSNGKNYSITFVDQDDRTVLANQEVTANSGGNTFVIDNLPMTTKTITAKIVVVGTSKNVYYYSGSGQDWIGVNSGNYETELRIVNDYEAKGQITVYKVADQSINVEVTYSDTPTSTNKCGSNGCLEEAEFVLYAEDKKTIISEFITSNQGFVINKLADGTYYLYEQEPPYGYTRYKFTGDNVDKDGYIKIVITKGNAASVVVDNDLIKVCFEKLDSVTKEPIDGVTFNVEDAEGSIYESFITSSQYKQYCLAERQLESGYYYLVEEETPAKYTKIEKPMRFSVGTFDVNDIVVDYEEGSMITIENNNGVVVVENKPGIYISKSDVATGDCVPGAKLTVKDADGNKVDEWTSTCEDGNDSHKVELEPGDYTLTEELAPSGYATAESIEFTVDKNGNVSTSLDMKDAMIEACFEKVSGSNKGIEGAEFELYDANGKLYKKFTTAKNPTCFQYIPVGKYTLKETKAPNGYKALDKPIEITIKDTDKTQNFTINNEALVEKTAMDKEQLTIIIASVFMICGLGLVLYYGYKKQA